MRREREGPASDNLAGRLLGHVRDANDRCGLGRMDRLSCFFFQAEDGIRDYKVTGVQTCALPISRPIRRLGCASVTLPIATEPLGITRTPFTATSSSTSKSTESPVCASADETLDRKSVV